jgi:hypothetical protein
MNVVRSAVGFFMKRTPLCYWCLVTLWRSQLDAANIGHPTKYSIWVNYLLRSAVFVFESGHLGTMKAQACRPSALVSPKGKLSLDEDLAVGSRTELENDGGFCLALAETQCRSMSNCFVSGGIWLGITEWRGCEASTRGFLGWPTKHGVTKTVVEHSSSGGGPDSIYGRTGSRFRGYPGQTHAS